MRFMMYRWWYESVAKWHGGLSDKWFWAYLGELYPQECPDIQRHVFLFTSSSAILGSDNHQSNNSWGYNCFYLTWDTKMSNTLLPVAYGYHSQHQCLQWQWHYTGSAWTDAGAAPLLGRGTRVRRCQVARSVWSVTWRMQFPLDSCCASVPCSIAINRRNISLITSPQMGGNTTTSNHPSTQII